MTTTTTLPRVTTVPDSLASLDAALATSVANRLGYTGMQQQLALTAREQGMYAALLAAGVQPLDPKAVARYKAKMQLRTWLRPLAVQLAIGLVVVVTIAMPPPPFWVVFLGSIAAVLGSFLLWGVTQPACWAWRRSRLSGYTRPIPPHVLMTALLVEPIIKPHGFNNMVYFAVDEWKWEETVKDPFLVVVSENPPFELYLEVWDEPTFKAS